MDNKLEIINKIKIKNYIKIILLQKNILKKFNLNFNENILINLLRYYPKLKYNITKNYITVSKTYDDKYKFHLKNCSNDIKNNPCKPSNKKYKIIIGFNTKSQIYLPFDLLTLECNNDNKLIKFTKNIENTLKKDKYLKNIISYVIFTKNDKL